MADGTEEKDGDPQLRDLGGYIRLQRQLSDLSLRQLAGMTKVSNAYLSQIERGLHQPSLRVLRSIADALNLSADTMLAQAGLLDPTAPPADGPAARKDTAPRTGGPAAGKDTAPRTDEPVARRDTEEAILSDPELAPDDRQALLRVYRSLRQRQGDA